MSVATYGKLDDFDNQKEDWTSYIECLEQFLEANEIVATMKQRSILLSTCGANTYKRFRSLCAPVKLGDKTYAELCALMKQHQNPTPNLIAERLKFHTRDRKQDESIAAYMAELRIMTEFCGYGEALEDMLRDRLVCGINDQRLQQWLLGEGSKLNLKKALDISLGMESAIRHATAITSHHQQQIKVESEINKVHAPNNRNPSQPFHRSNDRSNIPNSNECFHCGGRHNAATCQFKHQECFFCHTRDTHHECVANEPSQ